MNQDDSVPLTPEQERVLVRALAEAVLEHAAPEELVVFDETTEEFFHDPDRVLHARRRDEPVGFGLEMELLTPYVLAVVGPVVNFLVSIVPDAVREGSKTFVAEWIRRLVKDKAAASPADTGSVPALTSEQARQVHELVHERATDLGLPETTASLLADSVVGGVLMAG